MRLEDIFTGTPVTLENVLDRKTARAKRQKELLSDGPCLVCFSLNIAGNVKQFPLAKAAFKEGLAEIRRRLDSRSVITFETYSGMTGSEAMLLLDAVPKEVKEKMTALEENHPLGRLFDIDVLGGDGLSLSRSLLGLPSRTCLICGQDAKICARSQAHSMELIRWKTASMLERFFRDRAADHFASCAVRSLLHEVSATPKPGLVDRANSGSHRDMDFFTFLNSSAALTPWFREFFCIGWDCAGETAPLLFSKLRFAGQQAEAAMFEATGGVNTHKGLIFSFAILCGALGSAHADRDSSPKIAKILERCRRLGECSLADFKDGKKDGLGARGEAALGFPAAVTLGVPSLRYWLRKDFSLNDAAVLTLLTLISAVDDTNMIHRGGAETARRCRADARRLISEITAANFKEKLTALDADYIRQNLSPGGCADLLAVSLMLHFISL